MSESWQVVLTCLRTLPTEILHACVRVRVCALPLSAGRVGSTQAYFAAISHVDDCVGTLLVGFMPIDRSVGVGRSVGRSVGENRINGVMRLPRVCLHTYALRARACVCVRACGACACACMYA